MTDDHQPLVDILSLIRGARIAQPSGPIDQGFNQGLDVASALISGAIIDSRAPMPAPTPTHPPTPTTHAPRDLAEGRSPGTQYKNDLSHRDEWPIGENNIGRAEAAADFYKKNWSFPTRVEVERCAAEACGVTEAEWVERSRSRDPAMMTMVVSARRLARATLMDRGVPFHG